MDGRPFEAQTPRTKPGRKTMPASFFSTVGVRVAHDRTAAARNSSSDPRKTQVDASKSLPLQADAVEADPVLAVHSPASDKSLSFQVLQYGAEQGGSASIGALQRYSQQSATSGSTNVYNNNNNNSSSSRSKNKQIFGSMSSTSSAATSNAPDPSRPTSRAGSLPASAFRVLNWVPQSARSSVSQSPLWDSQSPVHVAPDTHSYTATSSALESSMGGDPSVGVSPSVKRPLARAIPDPWCLSSLASALRDLVSLHDRFHYGLLYKDSFSGTDAVDGLGQLMGTGDRGLAVEVGRSMQQQGFLSEINYENLLADNPSLIFQFTGHRLGGSISIHDISSLSNIFVSVPPTNTDSTSDYDVPIVEQPMMIVSASSSKANAKCQTPKTTGAESVSSEPAVPSSANETTQHSMDSLEQEDLCTISAPVETSEQVVGQDGGLLMNFNRRSILTETKGSSSHGADSRDSGTDGAFEARQAHDSLSRKIAYPVGVVVTMTPCYSPRCNSVGPLLGCYSFTCRSRQQMSTRVLTLMHQNQSKANSMIDMQAPTLWSNSVPAEVLDAIVGDERKRQEIIFEIIATEREYVEDLQMIKRVYLEPLERSDIIPRSQRTEFLRTVFVNISELVAINEQLEMALYELQLDNPTIYEIGSAFLPWSLQLQPYLIYGANQVLAKHVLDAELRSNIAFKLFCESNERKAECRKLPIQSFLARPTTRLGRYPIMIESLLSKTYPNHVDAAMLNTVLERIRGILSAINLETGRADNSLRLRIINDRLIFRHKEEHYRRELALLDPERQIIRDGILRKRGKVEFVDLEVFLLDNFLLLTKRFETESGIMYRVHKSPISLLLLHVSDAAESDQLYKIAMESVSSGFRRGKSSGRNAFSPSSTRDSGSHFMEFKPHFFPIILTHLGRNGSQLQLMASSQADRTQWVVKLEKAINAVRKKYRSFQLRPLLSKTMDPPRVEIKSMFLVSNQINYTEVVLGTDHGIFVGRPGDVYSFFKIFDFQKVTLMEHVPQFRCVLFLADDALTYTAISLSRTAHDVDLLDVNAKKVKRLTSHVSLFKVGQLHEKTVIVVIKTKILSSYIKLYEHADIHDTKRRPRFEKLLARITQTTTDKDFRRIQEIYIPSESLSVHFLKNKLCVGCKRGFELIDVLSMCTQALLDPTDESLDFAVDREDLSPLALFRVAENEYLLCYKGVNETNGPHIEWVSLPVSFVCDPPYILAFDHSMLEVRDCLSGRLIDAVPLRNAHLTCSESGTIHLAEVVDVTSQSSTTGSPQTSPIAVSPTSALAQPATPTSSGSSQGLDTDALPLSVNRSGLFSRTSTEHFLESTNVREPCLHMSVLYQLVIPNMEVPPGGVEPSTSQTMTVSPDGVNPSIAQLRSNRKFSIRSTSFEEVFQSRQRLPTGLSPLNLITNEVAEVAPPTAVKPTESSVSFGSRVRNFSKQNIRPATHPARKDLW